jgi:hypothetical protein
MKNHLFISETDGCLYDTRKKDWSTKPLRENYKRAHRHIKTTADLKATIRYGEFAWPGGYQMFFITSDGAVLSFDSVKAELRSVLDSINTKTNDGWRVVVCDINYEDTALYCDHSGEKIESSYGD